MPLPGIYASQISGHLYTGPYGAYDALASVTIPVGQTATSITFAGIPAGYKHLQIRIMSRSTNAAYYSQLAFQINGASSYFRHLLLADGVNSPPGAYGYTGQGFLSAGYLTGSYALTNVYGVAVVDILDYANVNKYKTIRALGGASNNSQASPDTYVSYSSGTYPGLDAVNSINFYPESGLFVANSSISIYGVK